jgi:hypothetical protein
MKAFLFSILVLVLCSIALPASARGRWHRPCDRYERYPVYHRPVYVEPCYPVYRRVPIYRDPCPPRVIYEEVIVEVRVYVEPVVVLPQKVVSKPIPPPEKLATPSHCTSKATFEWVR